MIINFGYILKKARQQLGISRSEMISILDLSSENGSNVDSVAICRWESNTIVPCHTRQIDLLKKIGVEMIDLIDERAINLGFYSSKSQLADKLLPTNRWDFNDQLEINGAIRCQKIVGKSSEDVSYSFSDQSGLILGQITYSIESNVESKTNQLIIKSIFCSVKEVMLEMFSLVLSKITSHEVSTVSYYSSSRSSHIIKFLKSVGFEMQSRIYGSYVVSISYDEIIESNKLFVIACGKVFIDKISQLNQVTAEGQLEHM